jgi:hypothetical protein
MAELSDDADLASKRLEGAKFLTRLRPLLGRLRDEACDRDRAGNRELFFDQLCGLILLSFFEPTLKSLRDLRAVSGLVQVRTQLGCRETSLGPLSEALRVFDSERLVEIVQELLGRIPDSPTADPRLKRLAHVPTAVDGTLLRKLPQITQACFGTRTDRGWKLHTQFEVLRGVPSAACVTDASGKGPAGEKAVLRASLEADRCYVIDRGYEDFSLFNDVAAAGSSDVCRVRNDHGFTAADPGEPGTAASRPVTAEAAAAGVIEDVEGRMGSPKSVRIEHPDHRQRRIVVRLVEHPKRGGRRRAAATHDVVLVTNLLDVPAEVVALLYRFRWLIELFFRWLKCVLQCRHLISQSRNGIEIQMSCALIAWPRAATCGRINGPSSGSACTPRAGPAKRKFWSTFASAPRPPRRTTSRSPRPRLAARCRRVRRCAPRASHPPGNRTRRPPLPHAALADRPPRTAQFNSRAEGDWVPSASASAERGGRHSHAPPVVEAADLDAGRVDATALGGQFREPGTAPSRSNRRTPGCNSRARCAF